MNPFGALLESDVSWEVELTSRCNSKCVGCSRFSHYVHPNPYFQSNLDLDPDVLMKALASTPRPKAILFCGVYGDPLLHPRLLEILARIDESHPSLALSVHSNASFGTPDFWQSLAPHFARPGRHIQFALDGQAPEHEAFRHGTSWERTLKNARTFIAAGGRAIWKMIEFRHNTAQVEELRRLAEENGFLRLDLRKNNYPGLDDHLGPRDTSPEPPEVRTPPQPLEETLRAWERDYLSPIRAGSIDCKSLSRRSLYLDVHGDVWPCCWVGGLPYRPEHVQRIGFERNVLSRQPAGFNRLKNHELRDILGNSWFRETLPTSWSRGTDDPAAPLTPICAKTCGKCREAEA